MFRVGLHETASSQNNGGIVVAFEHAHTLNAGAAREEAPIVGHSDLQAVRRRVRWQYALDVPAAFRRYRCNDSTRQKDRQSSYNRRGMHLRSSAERLPSQAARTGKVMESARCVQWLRRGLLLDLLDTIITAHLAAKRVTGFTE